MDALCSKFEVQQQECSDWMLAPGNELDQTLANAMRDTFAF